MRLGCCGSMIAPAADPVGVEMVEQMAAMGFDYIELSLAHLATYPKRRFAALVDRVARSGLPCEACNNFFPPHVRLTGPEADPAAALNYATRAMARAARLGVKVIVLGSSGAKNVPRGFPKQRAWGQFEQLLLRLAPPAERYGLTIALEPISAPEANFINRAAEALRLVRRVDHPSIRLLVDYYHLTRQGENPKIIGEAGAALVHVHLARMEGRAFPTRWGKAFADFFGQLNAIHYPGRCSIEAVTSDFAADGPRALKLLRDGTQRIMQWSN